MAIWPSWVSAIGQDRRTVSLISARQTARSVVGADGAAMMVPGKVMTGRTITDGVARERPLVT